MSSTQQIEELYRLNGSELLSYIRKCGGGSCSEDLLQETFVRVMERPERIGNVRSPRAWLYGVARNVVHEFMRRQSRVKELTIDPPAPARPEEDPRTAVLRAAMAKLPHDQYEALRMRLDAEFSYEEIAITLNIPIGTVRSRLHYAVRKLRAALCGKEMEYE